MAISTGSKILLTDYNALQTNVSNVLGTGSGNLGYGQSLTSVNLTGTPRVQAADWANLKIDLLKIANHQGVSSNASIVSLIGASFTGVITTGTLTVSSVTGTIAIGDAVIGLGVSVGTYITGGSGATWTVTPSQSVSSTAMKSGGQFSSGDRIGALTLQSFSNAYTSINSNTFAIAQYSDESFSPTISNSRTASWGTPSIPAIVHAFTVDFGSANAARYFFNSGSSLRFSGSRILGSGSTQDTNWSTMFTNMSAVIFNYNSTTASSGTGSSIGFYNLTSSNQTIFTISGSGNYSTNSYTVQARCDVVNNSTGTARYVYITITLTDTHSNAFSDVVDGTITSAISMRRASGSNVSVTAPTATNTTLLTNDLYV